MSLDGRDPDYLRDQLPALWMLASAYFRAEVTGLERLPAHGPVLLVSNHPRGFALPNILAFTLAHNAFFGVERRLHALLDRAVTGTVGQPWLARLGVLPAGLDTAKSAVEAGSSLMVDVARGIELAMAGDLPIAPVACVGGENPRADLLPWPPLAAGRFAARIARHLPVPAKVTIRVLEPFHLAEQFGPDIDVSEVRRTVTARIESTVDGLGRAHPFRLFPL